MSDYERFFDTIPRVECDENGFASDAALHAFTSLSHKDMMKQILWNRAPSATTSRTRQTEESRQETLDSSPKSISTSAFIINLGGERIELPIKHFGRAKKFITPMTNMMTLDQFQETYLKPAMNDWSSSEILDVDNSTIPFVVPSSTVEEGNVQYYVMMNLIGPIAELQKANLRLCLDPQKLKDRFIRFYKDKVKVKHRILRDSGSIEIEYMSAFYQNLKGVGLATKPDYILGYCTQVDTVILPIGLGEIKTPLSGIEPIYHLINNENVTFRNLEYNNIQFEFDMNGVPIQSQTGGYPTSPNLMLQTLNTTVSKLVSTMIHSGTKKGYISHYTSIIFIDLDENFVVKKEPSVVPVESNSKKAMSKSKKKKAAETENRFVVKGNHILLSSSDPMIRAYITAFFWVSKKSLKSQEKFRNNIYRWFNLNGGDDIEEIHNDPKGKTSGFTGKQSGRQLSKKVDDTGGRKRMKGSQGQTFKTDSTTYGRLQVDKKRSDVLVSSDSPTEKEASDSGFESTESANTSLMTSLDTSFHINTGIFTKIIPIKMEGLISEYLKYESDDYSSHALISLNVATVNFKSFIKYLPAENRCLFNKATESFFEKRANWPVKAIFKVYDTDIEKYQEHAQKCYNELKIYEKLKSGMNNYVPQLYGAGLFYDETINIGLPYWRMNGPFILEQYFEPLKDFKISDVTLSIFQQEVLPAFNFIHSCQIVHNDLSDNNLIFIRISGQIRFRLIDFSESFETDEEQYFDQEIERVYRHFGFPFPT